MRNWNHYFEWQLLCSRATQRLAPWPTANNVGCPAWARVVRHPGAYLYDLAHASTESRVRVPRGDSPGEWQLPHHQLEPAELGCQLLQAVQPESPVHLRTGSQCRRPSTDAGAFGRGQQQPAQHAFDYQLPFPKGLGAPSSLDCLMNDMSFKIRLLVLMLSWQSSPSK